MRPIEFQPAIVQAPGIEQTVQQQVANPQTAQQAFAAEMQRRASERPVQVQGPEAKEGSQPGVIKPEEHGERRARRKLHPRRKAAPVEGSRGVSPSGETPTAPSGAAGSRLDVVI